MKTKVILVDDHAVVRAGFKMLLSTNEGIEVIAEAERGEQAIQLYQEKQPDIMVMDISMPGIGGLEAIRRICERHGNAKILVFSVHEEAIFISRALDAGAMGFISKSSAANILIKAIQCIMQGQIYVEEGLNKTSLYRSEVTEKIDHQAIINAFSPREFDIFLLLAKGQTGHKIAEQLCMGYKTVANYSTQIKKKLNVSNVAELAHIAVLYGMVNH